MPGKRDYISIGRNIHVQKRLILSNLKELYAEFKSKYPDLKVWVIVAITDPINSALL